MQRIGIGIVMLLGASACCPPDSSGLKPPSSNARDAHNPKVDSNLRVQISFKAPEALKVRGNRRAVPRLIWKCSRSVRDAEPKSQKPLAAGQFGSRVTVVSLQR